MRRGAEVERFYAGIRANWINDEPPTDSMIGRWFMQVYPISDLATWERLRDGIARDAGFAVDGLTHAEGPDVNQYQDDGSHADVPPDANMPVAVGRSC